MRRVFLTVVSFCVLFLAGCSATEQTLETGTETSAQAEDAGLPESKFGDCYELLSSQEDLTFSLAENERLLCMQYFDGEIMQLFGKTEEDGITGRVYLRRAGVPDELLIEEVSVSYVSLGSKWYTDGEYYYIAQGRFLVVLDKEGEVVYRLIADGRIEQISQTKDGNIILTVIVDYMTNLMVLDKESKTLVKKNSIDWLYAIAQGAEEDILVADGVGLYDFNLETGKKTFYMKWEGTTYQPGAGMGNIADFKLLSADEAELIKQNGEGKRFFAEKLSKVSYEDIGKTVLTYRTTYATQDLKLVTAQFNRENEEYYVRLEERGEMDYHDFVTATTVELTAGKGPDMLSPDAVSDMYSLAEKGVIEDLEPYMADSGIAGEDYFPIAFQSVGQETGTFAFCYCMQLEMIYLSEDIVGDGQNLNCAELLNRMQNYEGEAVFNKIYEFRPQTVLYYFLGMSDDFYGMVDWEQGTCDFGGEMWEDMLTVSARFGFTEESRGYEDIAFVGRGSGFLEFADSEEEAESLSMVPVGRPAENGMIPRNDVFVSVCMNADSANKEGVWQYMQYLFEQENQMSLCNIFGLPVSKAAYEQKKQKELQLAASIAEGMKAPDYVPTEEQLARLEEFLQESQMLSYRTAPIWDIIADETAMYFSGEKSMEEVSRIINNRVGLYLAEQQ
ncbi:MAG: extracellular solute-binding protein [Lachnospiraceae bacterium]|nr:extracellular solute-binding protein [Lachnospiraceae bacterium]